MTTYLVNVRAHGVSVALYEVEAPNVHFARKMAERDPNFTASSVSAYEPRALAAEAELRRIKGEQ